MVLSYFAVSRYARRMDTILLHSHRLLTRVPGRGFLRPEPCNTRSMSVTFAAESHD